MVTYKFGFLILHYQVLNETIACVESIKKNISKDFEYHILIVDNHSPNQSGVQLNTLYDSDPLCTVLLLNENKGFSGGNNEGFQYLKKKLQCDFICMMNNDTEILQKDFMESVLAEYQKSNFAVLGPEIILKDNTICSYPKKILKLAELDADRKRVKKLLVKNRLFIESIHFFCYKYIGKLIHWEKIKYKYREMPIPDSRMEYVRLHGCFLIFSPVYIHVFDGLDNRTFFYGEEDVLFVRLIRNHMKSVYQPDIKVYHAEEAATGALMGRKYKKQRFIYKKHLETLDMLEELYKEDIESIKEYIL